MPRYIFSPKVDSVLKQARMLATVDYRSEYVTPEHVLLALLSHEDFEMGIATFELDGDTAAKRLKEYIETLRLDNANEAHQPEHSEQYYELLSLAKQINKERSDSPQPITLIDLTMAISQLPLSVAANVLNEMADETVLEVLCTFLSISALADATEKLQDSISNIFSNHDYSSDEDEDYEEVEDDGFFATSHDDNESDAGVHTSKLVTCINDIYTRHNPLIGRQAELEQTMLVLCRKQKNNPLHVGEPGVGKTALIYGLAALIESGKVPQKLKGCRIFMLDMTTMVAGTQYRGEFEKRMKSVLDQLARLDCAIVYIDEIHTIMGAGATGEGTNDAANILKPYLEDGKLRFIGATTHQEFDRHIAKNAGIMRRFQTIDVAEPSEDEAIKILEGLRETFENFHNVSYEAGTLDFAVRASAKHITNRRLPDKAIDIMDQAGAYLQLHPQSNSGDTQKVDKRLMEKVLAEVCKIHAEALKEEGNEALASMQSTILSQIFGQDEAVAQVVQAVQLAKAGLSDDSKPLASLLFVGPTGVGKTEVAKVLASTLGVELVRFDMSEYTEKHSVAKLIGSPAGYVGYEDGGLLTAAINKSPNCVLLLDEIEKAHQEIYNVLLQVMDYASLTDNRGRHADFHNVIIIMTSNAGAQHAGKAVGFELKPSRGQAMLATVKRTFKPEFINRLTSIVTFNDMTRGMASLILDKRLNELQRKLDAKHVVLTLADEAREWLLDKGFTPEYGARELDRVLTAHLKMPLSREILFGALTDGGKATATIDRKGNLALSTRKARRKTNSRQTTKK